MRMLFIFICLIYSSVALAANATLEDCYNNTDVCNTTAGCWFDGEDCIPCPPEHYCPSTDNQPISCSTGTQSRYPNSDSGAKTSGDCYRPVTCDKHPSGTESCRYYGEQAGGQGVWCPNNTGGDYHVEHLAEFEQNNLNALECYANTRNCNKFVPDVNNIQISGCQAYAQGEATWYNNKWNIMNCRYGVGDQQHNCLIQLSDGTHNVKCVGKAILGPNPQGNTNSPNANITSVDDSIVYDRISDAWPLPTPDSTSSRGYLCYGCPDGYYISEDDLQVMQGSGQDQGDLKYRECVRPWNYNQDPVCNCTIAPKGYYTDSDTYGPCEFNYPFQFGNDRRCEKYKCPAGKTTDSTGTHGLANCQYGSDTQFCDNNGANCVSFSTIGTGWGDY